MSAPLKVEKGLGGWMWTCTDCLSAGWTASGWKAALDRALAHRHISEPRGSEADRAQLRVLLWAEGTR